MECISGIIALLTMIGTLFDEDKPTSQRVIIFIFLLVVAILFLVVIIRSLSRS